MLRSGLAGEPFKESYGGFLDFFLAHIGWLFRQEILRPHGIGPAFAPGIAVVNCRCDDAGA